MSSVHLGVLPDTVGPTFDRIDWIPIDQLASMLVELAVQPPPSNGTAAVYHLQNPHPTTWASMLPDLVHAIRAATGKSVSPVPAARWLQRLRENDVDPHAASDHLRAAYATNPGLALLDTYAELMNETTAATVRSWAPRRPAVPDCGPSMASVALGCTSGSMSGFAQHRCNKALHEYASGVWRYGACDDIYSRVVLGAGNQGPWVRDS
jgi:hypothetical protein